MNAVDNLSHQSTRDFCTVVHALAYDENDFEFRPIKWPRTARPETATHDLMIVHRKSSGVRRAYPIDPSASGMFTFFDDLFAGAFGQR